MIRTEEGSNACAGAVAVCNTIEGVEVLVMSVVGEEKVTIGGLLSITKAKLPPATVPRSVRDDGGKLMWSI